MKLTVFAQRKKRSERGMGMLFIICSSTVVFAFIGVFFVQLIMVASISQRCANAVDCAALQIANELGTVIVDDPDLGYVSLIDREPEESMRKAADGRPLPVNSVNTLLGNVRFQLILAEKLHNPHLKKLALADLAKVQHAAHELEDAISRELGKRGRLYKRGLDIYNTNLCLGLLECSTDMRVELGVLDSGSTTYTPTPDRTADEDTPKSICDEGMYKSFVNAAVQEHDIYFAGVGERPSLVSGKSFRTKNVLPEQIRSVLRVKAESMIKPPLGGVRIPVSSTAFSQAGGNWTSPKTGALIAYFYGGSPEGASIATLASDQVLGDKQVANYTASNGDYPLDPHSVLQTVQTGPFAETVASALYDWIKHAGVKPQMTDLLSFLNAPLVDLEHECSKEVIMNPTLIANFDDDGKCVYGMEKEMPIEEQVTAEKQVCAECDEAITTDRATWNFTCRNYIHNIGDLNGGKHAGLPLEISTKAENTSDLLTNGISTIFDLHVVAGG